jgi:hypothetical protein
MGPPAEVIAVRPNARTLTTSPSPAGEPHRPDVPHARTERGPAEISKQQSGGFSFVFLETRRGDQTYECDPRSRGEFLVAVWPRAF